MISVALGARVTLQFRLPQAGLSQRRGLGFPPARRASQSQVPSEEAYYFSTTAGSSPAALSPSLRNSPPSTRSSSHDSPLIASAISRA